MASSEVENLKEKLAAEISSNKTAAEYGLTLLKDNKSLKAMLQNQSAEHEKAVGKHLQDIHSLTGRLETKENQLRFLTAELDACKESYENKISKLKDNDKDLRRQLASLEKDRNHLELVCLEKDNEIRTLKEAHDELEEKLRENVASASSSCSDDTNSIEQRLFVDNQVLTKQKTELEEMNCEIKRELADLSEREENLRNSLQLLEQEIAYRDSKLTDFMEQKQQMQEENEELKSEVESLKLGEVDMKRRGNSLFGEVEDNRKALENEVKLLRSQRLDLIQRDEENQLEIRRMKNQIVMLLSMSDHKADGNYIQSLTQDLLQARGEVQELTAKLKVTEKQKSVEYSKVASPMEKTPECNAKGYEFMQVLVEDRNRKIEDLQSKLQSVSFSRTTLNNSLILAERRLYQAEKQCASLKAELMKMKLDVEDQKKVKCSVPVVKVEKIPGFQEKTNTPVDESANQVPAHKNVVQKSPAQEDKENVRIVSPNVAEVDTVNKVKEGGKKVQFAVEDLEEDSNRTNVKPSKSTRQQVQFTFVSSQNAPTPDQCAHQ